MSDKNFISELITNSHRAQIIHQNGLLVYANTAAARLFGFQTIDTFVKFTKTANLFTSGDPASLKTRTRFLNFQLGNGQQIRSQISERQIDWHGMKSSYLELEEIGGAQIAVVTNNDDLPIDDDETYFLNSMSAAMDWSRTDGGALELVEHSFDYGSVCLKMCDDLAEFAADRAVLLNVEVTPRAQKIFHGDALKMAKAGSCMVRYAIDRVLGGRVDVIVKADEKGEHIILQVCDNGMPYKPSDANFLFVPPPNCPGRRPSLGLAEGLELPLARCIARFLGGEVGLKINHSQGGLIQMRLPFKQVVQEQNTLRRTGKLHRQLNILIVEDNATSQHVLRVILEALGHNPTVASNGKECLKILRQANFDAILMDLHMPVKDGYATTRQIRALEKSGILLYDRPIPILAITADNRPEARKRAACAGVNGFLTKPVHIPQIMNALAPFIDSESVSIARQPRTQQSSQGA